MRRAAGATFAALHRLVRVRKNVYRPMWPYTIVRSPRPAVCKHTVALRMTNQLVIPADVSRDTEPRIKHVIALLYNILT